MEHSEILMRLTAAVEELDKVNVYGHENRKSMVLAVELMLDVITKMQEPKPEPQEPKEGESDGEVTEAE